MRDEIPFFASLRFCGLALRFDQTMNHEGHEGYEELKTENRKMGRQKVEVEQQTSLNTIHK
jgi:hypothetical protein